MSTLLYSRLSPATRRRYSEPEIDAAFRAVLAQHVRKTFADAVDHCLFKMNVRAAIKKALADPAILRQAYREAETRP